MSQTMLKNLMICLPSPRRVLKASCVNNDPLNLSKSVNTCYFTEEVLVEARKEQVLHSSLLSCCCRYF